MNYTELTAAIKEYTDNTETTFVSNIPTFVKQTEERIYRSILIQELRKKWFRLLARKKFQKEYRTMVLNG